jgi:hypothetical protein
MYYSLNSEGCSLSHSSRSPTFVFSMVEGNFGCVLMCCFTVSSPHVLNWLRCGEEGAWSTGMPSALFHQLVPAPMNRYTVFQILSVLHALGLSTPLTLWAVRGGVVDMIVYASWWLLPTKNAHEFCHQPRTHRLSLSCLTRRRRLLLC